MLTQEMCLKFVNRKDWSPSVNVGICNKHFKHDDMKQGEQRITLVRKNRPIPLIYDPTRQNVSLTQSLRSFVREKFDSWI